MASSTRFACGRSKAQSLELTAQGMQGQTIHYVNIGGQLGQPLGGGGAPNCHPIPPHQMGNPEGSS